MTPEQIQRIQTSFALAAPQAAAVADHFYDRLFILDPSLRPLFHGDLSKQKTKLMATLALVVKNLEKPDAILPAVRRLGERHLSYGVRPAHYATVGTALLETLTTCLGRQVMNPETAAAWTTAYLFLASEMQAAAAAVAIQTV